MPYLIDGHNLIPRIPGISLRDVDDEMQLVELLQEFCQRIRKRADVYFDNAPPNGLQGRSYGLVTAHFVRQGRTADQAIQAKLVGLGPEARNWTVVSSDHAVQKYGRAARARILPSEDFARLMTQTANPDNTKSGDNYDTSPSTEEVGEWLRLFGSDIDDEDS